MYIGALKGTTMYELQVGKFWIGIARPKFWNRRNKIVRFRIFKEG